VLLFFNDVHPVGTSVAVELFPMTGASRTSASVVGNYELGKTIGQGTFGKVKLATNQLTGEKVAVKIISHRGKMDKAALEREIHLQQRLHHQHVVGVHDVIEEEGRTFIFMELVPGGDLFDYMIKHVRLPEKEARRIFQQILSAVDHCHRRGVAHRDLKPENIFLDKDKNVKLGDFGLSGEIREGEFLTESCGSLNYAAPELLHKSCAYKGPEVDVWACGIVLFALLSNMLPFDSHSSQDLARKIRRGRYVVPGFVSAGAKDLISRMLTIDVEKRASIEEIREHQWFKADLPAQLFERPAESEPEDKERPTEIRPVLTNISNLVDISPESRDVVKPIASIVKLKSCETSGLEFHDCTEEETVAMSGSQIKLAATRLVEIIPKFAPKSRTATHPWCRSCQRILSQGSRLR